MPLDLSQRVSQVQRPSHPRSPFPFSSIQPLFGNLADPGRPLAVLQPAPTPRPKLELSASQSVVPHPTGIITRPLEVCRPILTRSTTRMTRILYNSNQLALFSSPRAPLALCPCCPPGARRSACSPARGRAGLRAGQINHNLNTPPLHVTTL